MNIYKVLFFLVLFSCTDTQKEVFQNSQKVKELKECDGIDNILLDEIEFIALETNEKCLLPPIDKIIYEDKIYLLCQQSSRKGVYIFDLKGNFIFSIRNFGKGPGEFTILTDITVDNNKIYISDTDQNQIEVYSSKDGSYIETKKTRCRITEVEVANNLYFGKSLIGKSSRKNDFFVITDNSLEKKKGYFSYEDYKFTNGNQLVKQNNNVYWVNTTLGEIYTYLDGSLFPIYEFDFENNKLNYSEYEKCENSRDIRKLNKAYFFANTCVGKDIIVNSFAIGNVAKKLYYNKYSNVCVYYDTVESGTFDFFLSPHTVVDNTIISSIDANTLLGFKKRYRETSGEFKYNITFPKSSISCNDNPILVLQKHKKNVKL